MHTISQRTAGNVLVRIGLVVLSVVELAGALTWRAAMGVVIWQERARERRRLASLDDHMLRDIGLSQADIHVEIRKPFWEA
jgi:uncharacterized protein YjiS (DUF1127 family)